MCASAPPPNRPPDPARPTDTEAQTLPPLPLMLRVLVTPLGWLLLLIGIAGLALPGIQGCVTIALGAALLSLASELIYRAMRRGLRRWPRVWNRVESLRAWTHAKLTRGRPIAPAPPADDGSREEE